MKNLLSKLEEIKARKVEELKGIDDVLIEYAILEEEINDVEYAIEACRIEDEDSALGGLYRVLMSTTSNSIYDTITDYFKSLDKVLFYDNQTGEYRSYNQMEHLAESLIEDALTNEWFSVPVFANEEEKKEFYLDIIDQYEYTLIKIA